MPDTESAQSKLIELHDVLFAWGGGKPILDIADFSMDHGESLFLEGPSGSGKSTLLGLICGVLTPDAGSIFIDGTEISNLDAAKRDALRADKLGVIFQIFNLLPYLPLLANVTLPCRFSKARAERAKETSGSVEDDALRLLDTLGLNEEEFLTRPVNQFSVGQQQRAAAARALIGAPSLIIADEPTSALDATTRDRFISLIKTESERTGAALLFVSHDPGLKSHFDRAVSLSDINRAAQIEVADI